MNADIPTEESVRKIALKMLNSIDFYIDGTIKDTDPECLHQYWVALRKLRSLIGLLKKALPEQTASLLQAKLSFIFRRTNTLRDLDFFLLGKDKHFKLLPGIFDDRLFGLSP